MTISIAPREHDYVVSAGDYWLATCGTLKDAEHYRDTRALDNLRARRTGDEANPALPVDVLLGIPVLLSDCDRPIEHNAVGERNSYLTLILDEWAMGPPT